MLLPAFETSFAITSKENQALLMYSRLQSKVTDLGSPLLTSYKSSEECDNFIPMISLIKTKKVDNSQIELEKIKRCLEKGDEASKEKALSYVELLFTTKKRILRNY